MHRPSWELASPQQVRQRAAEVNAGTNILEVESSFPTGLFMSGLKAGLI